MAAQTYSDPAWTLGAWGLGVQNTVSVLPSVASAWPQAQAGIILCGWPAKSGEESNVIEGRARFGYRHVIGPCGLEFLVDGGPAYFVPDQGSGRMNGVIGGSFALVIGF